MKKEMNYELIDGSIVRGYEITPPAEFFKQNGLSPTDFSGSQGIWIVQMETATLKYLAHSEILDKSLVIK